MVDRRRRKPLTWKGQWVRHMNAIIKELARMMEEKKMPITLQTRWILRARRFFWAKKNLNDLGSFNPCRVLLTNYNKRSFNEERTSCWKNISVSALLAECQCENQIHDLSDNTSKLCKRYLLFKTVGSPQLLNNSPYSGDKGAMGKVAFYKGYFHGHRYGPDWLNSRYTAGTSCEDHFDFLYVLKPW